MKKITSVSELKNAIELAESEQTVGWVVLKAQFHDTSASFKPAKLIQNTLKEVVSTPHLIDNLIDVSLSLASGYLTKRIIVGTSGNIVRKIFASAVQVGVTKFIANHTGTIKAISQAAIQKVFKKKDSQPEMP
jgi:hypothetical protein